MNKFNSFVASGIIASLLSSIGCNNAFALDSDENAMEDVDVVEVIDINDCAYGGPDFSPDDFYDRGKRKKAGVFALDSNEDTINPPKMYGGPDYFRKPSHKNDETTTVTVAKNAEDDSSDKSNENKESKGEKEKNKKIETNTLDSAIVETEKIKDNDSRDSSATDDMTLICNEYGCIAPFDEDNDNYHSEATTPESNTDNVEKNPYMYIRKNSEKDKKDNSKNNSSGPNVATIIGGIVGTILLAGGISLGIYMKMKK